MLWKGGQGDLIFGCWSGKSGFLPRQLLQDLIFVLGCTKGFVRMAGWPFPARDVCRALWSVVFSSSPPAGGAGAVPWLLSLFSVSFPARGSHSSPSQPCVPVGWAGTVAADRSLSLQVALPHHRPHGHLHLGRRHPRLRGALLRLCKCIPHQEPQQFLLPLLPPTLGASDLPWGLLKPPWGILNPPCPLQLKAPLQMFWRIWDHCCCSTGAHLEV